MSAPSSYPVGTPDHICPCISDICLSEASFRNMLLNKHPSKSSTTCHPVILLVVGVLQAHGRRCLSPPHLQHIRAQPGNRHLQADLCVKLAHVEAWPLALSVFHLSPSIHRLLHGWSHSCPCKTSLERSPGSAIQQVRRIHLLRIIYQICRLLNLFHITPKHSIVITRVCEIPPSRGECRSMSPTLGLAHSH